MAFTIRPAAMAKSDHETLIDLRDTQIAWLVSIGSTEQWGSVPTREAAPNISEKTRAWVERSERQVAWKAGDEEWCRAFIAESIPPAGSDSKPVPVAALVLEARASDYVHDVLPAHEPDDPFVYLTYLITNRDADAEAKKGAVQALFELANEETRKAGLKRICVDCYRGNGRKLVK
jgi:hypothetical protein